jgi:general stress protein YciG
VRAAKTLNHTMAGISRAMSSNPFYQRSTHMASNNQGNLGGKSNRGFASMDPQRQREIASEGGRAAHEKGTAHEFTSEEAREAGRKGGQARSQKRSQGSSSASLGGLGNLSNQSDQGEGEE